MLFLRHCVDISDKDTGCTSQPVDEEDLVSRKQNFENLDEVLDMNDYYILSPQVPNTQNSVAKWKFAMHWTTTKQDTSFGRAPNQNVIKHKPGQRRRAKPVTDSLEAFSLFITDNILPNCWVYQFKHPKLSKKIWRCDCKHKQIHTLWYYWSNWDESVYGNILYPGSFESKYM